MSTAPIRAARAAVFFVFALGALACGGDRVTHPDDGGAGAGAGGGSGGVILRAHPPFVGGTPTTPTVSVVLDAGNAATATIGVEGGTIVAHGAGGTTFTLTIPAGALLVPTRITVTPVTSMSGNEVAASSIATVQFAPDGLQFLRAGKLRIDLASKPTARAVGVGYTGAGEDFHLMPAVQGATAQSFELPISHFSAAGLANASPAAINALAQQLAASAQSRLEQELGAALAKKNGEPLTDADVAQIKGLLGDYYTQVVKPRLMAAQTDDAQLSSAVQTYFSWERATELLGLGEDFTNARTEGRGLVVSAVVNHYRQAYGRCAEKRDFTQVAEMISVIRFLELFGYANALPAEGIQGAMACAEMRLELTSSINTPGAWSWQTRGEAPLPLIRNPTTQVQSEGWHKVLNFTMASGFPCPATTSYRDGKIVILDFNFEPDKNGIKSVRLVYTPLAEGPFADVTQTCPAPLGTMTLPFAFGGDFGLLHNDEFKTDPLPAYYVTTGWEEGSGEVLMRKRYSRTESGRTEETELVIRHTRKALP